MAKKTKRSRRKAKRTKAAKSRARQQQPAPVSKRAVVTKKASAPAKVDLAQEYHYVFDDLRKIAIIAAIMFALLFVLAFVLR